VRTKGKLQVFVSQYKICQDLIILYFERDEYLA